MKAEQKQAMTVEAVDRFIRRREVEHLSGLGRVTIWRKEKEGTFPRRRKIGAQAVAWSLKEVQVWIATQQAA